MTPVLSIMSSFLYNVHIPYRCSYPVYHRSILSPTSSCPFHFAFSDCAQKGFTSQHMTKPIFSVFVGWCSSSFCFHPLCPKSLDWIGVQSNWFSLTFSKSIFQTIPVVECPLSSTSMFLRHTIPYSKSVFTILFFNFMFPLSNSPRLLNASLPMAIRRFTSSLHLQSYVIALPKYTNCRTCSTLWPFIVIFTFFPPVLHTLITFVFLMLIFIP